MSDSKELLFPVGRLVSGSLYNPQTTDAENRPLTYKTGANQGQPRVNYYFGVAIKKAGEQHWSQTPWGKFIWDIGHAAFPNGQASRPNFAWKIVDGDSAEHNANNIRPCDRSGYAGHWVINFSTGFAPGIFKFDDQRRLVQVTEKDFVKPGYFVEVFGTIAGNDSQQQPGVFINHKFVCFAGFGDVIQYGTDAASVPFGQHGGQLPEGASMTPPSVLQPAPQHQQVQYTPQVQPQYVPTQPHTQILNPQHQQVQPQYVPSATQQYVPAAQHVSPGITPEQYQTYIAAGLSPEQIAKLAIK